MPHAYCTKQDMIDRFSEKEITELTDRSIPPLGVIDDTVLDAALSDAASTIDGYIGGRYALPMAVVPEMLTVKACQIARWFLYDNHPTDHVTQAYEDCIKYLGMVARGTVQLGLADDNAAPQGANNAEMVSGGRVFGRGNSGGFI